MPRYRQISEMLRNRIESEKLPKHTLLPSQNELARDFGVTPMTVLRALDELIHEGIIYRKQGAGTFVAPRRNRSPILLVPPADDNRSLTIRTEFAEFFLGTLEAANCGNLAYQPEIIGREELISQLPDLRLIYPKLGGVIFMREFQLLEPFGKGNTKPLFAQQHFHIAKGSIIGKHKNVMKFQVIGEDQAAMDALYFGDPADLCGYIEAEYGKEQLDRMMDGRRNDVDLAFTYYPSVNEFRGIRSLQIIIQNYCRIPR